MLINRNMRIPLMIIFMIIKISLNQEISAFNSTSNNFLNISSMNEFFLQISKITTFSKYDVFLIKNVSLVGEYSFKKNVCINIQYSKFFFVAFLKIGKGLPVPTIKYI